MKKNVLLVMVWAATLGVEAQGLVQFNNSSVTRISTNSFFGGGPVGPAAAAAGQFYFALFYSTTATTVAGSGAARIPNGADYSFSSFVFNDPNWKLAAYGTNSASADGRFLSSQPNADGSTTVNGVAGGSTAQFVVLGWSANLGSTLSAMESNLYSFNYFPIAWLGESAVSGSLTLGNGIEIVPAFPFGNVGMPYIPGFTLGQIAVVPEPSSLALVSTAIASLILFRRRRNS